QDYPQTVRKARTRCPESEQSAPGSFFYSDAEPDRGRALFPRGCDLRSPLPRSCSERQTPWHRTGTGLTGRSVPLGPCAACRTCSEIRSSLFPFGGVKLKQTIEW